MTHYLGKSILATAALLLLCASCKQDVEPTRILGDLTGKVTDYDTGNPIANAIITIGGTSSARTGADGYYAITDMDPGNYSVIATAEGFESSTRSIIVKANYTTQCDYALYTSSGSISVDPVSVNMGTNLASLQITVKNTGRKALSITAASTGSWLKVNPTSFNLPTNGSASVSVSVDRETFSYAAEYTSNVEFNFDGNTVPVQVSCTATEEQVNGSLRSSCSDIVFTKNDIYKPFTLTNNGQTPVSFQVEPSSDCSAWISSVSPTFGTLGVGGEQEIVLFIDRSKIVESGTVDGHVTVSYASRSKQLSIHLTVDAGDAVKPEVSTPQVELASYNSVKLTGELVSVGSHPVLDYGICYSLSSSPEITDDDSKVLSLGNATMPSHIEKSVSNLEGSKTYHFRIYARNAVGIVYSESVQFDISANCGDVSGTVTNKYTRTPVSQALVEVSGNRTYTDEKGNYYIPGIPVGAYDLYISAESFTSSKSLVTVSYARTTVCNCELEPAIPSIEVSPNRLDFGSECGMLVFAIENVGATIINYDISTAAGWVSAITPSTGCLGIGGKAEVKVYISRDACSEKGTYDSVVKIISEAGEDYVTVSMMVGVLTPPTVKANSVTDVKCTSARCECSIVSIGSNIVSEYGICISEQDNPTTSDDVFYKAVSVNSPTDYSIDVNNLKPGTEYYVRAYAKSSAGLAYSAKSLSFKTNTTSDEDVNGDGTGSDFNDNTW